MLINLKFVQAVDIRLCQNLLIEIEIAYVLLQVRSVIMCCVSKLLLFAQLELL